MSRALARCHSIADLRQVARRRLPRAVFDYMDGAAEDEVALRRNSDDFSQYALIPRCLTGVKEADLSVSVLGVRIATPFVLAPTGMSRLFHHAGEAAAARAAHKAGTLYSLSSMSTLSIEEVAAAAPGPKLFQLYVWRDRELLRQFINRARAAGYCALCLTVDLPVAGQRERDLRNGFTVPPQLRLANALDILRRPSWLWRFLSSPRLELANVRDHAGAAQDLFSVIDYTSSQFDPAVTWKDLAWIISEWDGPFAIKGILNAADARRAVDAGATAVIVSNHGGRQLDQAPSPLSVLPEIAAAVGDKAEVILDGGVRRGADVIKALALGAKAVMIGRAYLFGLGAGGEAGVDRALRLLTEEIRRNLMLLGCRSAQEVEAACLRRVDPAGRA